MSGLLERYAFGWIEQPWTYATLEFSAYPVERFASAVAEVSGALASSEWIYPPAIERLGRHEAGPSIRFMLPPTHYLTIDPALDQTDMSDFLILFLGFLLGLNLKASGLGHLHRTPRRMGHLVNFTTVGRDLGVAMSKAIKFFRRYEQDREVLQLMNAALHWYLTSQSYHHAFEMFTFQYSVLDAIHRLTWKLYPGYRRMSGTHAQRPVNLSVQYGLPFPSTFADSSSTQPNAARLGNARNELVHEARWLGQPLGYSADSRSWDMLMNLKHFNSQLLLSAVGIQCRFCSVFYDRQTHALDVMD